METEIKIKDAEYKDVPAVEVNTGKVTALFLPGFGGKLASLQDCRTGREFLAQAAGKNYKKLDYEGDYVAAECSSFDDMFPTVDKYYYNIAPWQGTEVADHGEVCGLAWQCSKEEKSLHMWVYSPKFGYKFEKWISAKEGKLLIDYRVTNNTQFEFDFLYGAHCMIAAEQGAKIETEFGEGRAATLIFDRQNKRGRYGSPFVWQADSGITPAKTDKANYKIFFDEPAQKGWGKYTYTDGTSILMHYSADKLPYLGIWFNWGDLNGLYNFAFEPCSASYDRPDLARMHNQYSTLAPYGTYEWSISFEVGKE